MHIAAQPVSLLRRVELLVNDHRKYDRQKHYACNCQCTDPDKLFFSFSFASCGHQISSPSP